MSFEFLSAFDTDWQAVSRSSLYAWIVAYALFLFYAARNHTGFLFIDLVNLPVHESGHLVFGWFGQTIGIAGGTIMELLAPAALAVYFASVRKPFGTAFALFIFFENFLYIATYMADARAQALPLVSVGGGETIHDWFYLFSKFGVLEHDVGIARCVRFCGWLGMIGTILWLATRTTTGNQHEQDA